MLKRTLIVAGLLSGVPTPVQADNIAACDAVIMTDLEDGAASISSFRDASVFIASVMDTDAEPVTEIDGHAIAALMCTRRSPIPTAADVPLIQSGVPFVLSTDFESSDAPTINIALNEDGRAFAMMAAGLTDDQESALMAYLDAIPAVDMDSADASEESMGAE